MAMVFPLKVISWNAFRWNLFCPYQSIADTEACPPSQLQLEKSVSRLKLKMFECDGRKVVTPQVNGGHAQAQKPKEPLTNGKPVGSPPLVVPHDRIYYLHHCQKGTFRQGAGDKYKDVDDDRGEDMEEDDYDGDDGHNDVDDEKMDIGDAPGLAPM